MRSILLILIFNVTNIFLSTDQVLAKQQIAPFSGQININKNGNLSVEIKDTPLIDVVYEIMRHTNIKFKIHAENNPRITCRFVNMSLKTGLKRLFRDFDYIFVHADEKSDDSGAVIESIILLSGNLMPNADYQSKKEIIPQHNSQSYSDLRNPDAETRQKAIREMKDTEIQANLADITTMLVSDPDEQVRSEAVQALASQDSEERISILVDALDDESEKVRNQVITTLGVIDSEEASEAFRKAVDNLGQQ